jgi:N-acetyltransferase
LSYTQGAIDDETLHKKHCARVQRGLEWGKEEEKEAYKAGVRVVEDFVRIQGHIGAMHGRIIAIPAHVGGKIGAKVFSWYNLWNITHS